MLAFLKRYQTSYPNVVFGDISKAFDSVHHKKLTATLQRVLGVPPHPSLLSILMICMMDYIIPPELIKYTLRLPTKEWASSRVAACPLCYLLFTSTK